MQNSTDTSKSRGTVSRRQTLVALAQAAGLVSVGALQLSVAAQRPSWVARSKWKMDALNGTEGSNPLHEDHSMGGYEDGGY